MFFDTMREDMIKNQLIARGINDERILSAFRKVKREQFVSDNLKNMSYNDSALPISFGQTISQPYIVAKMTQLLNPGPDDTVLEIGTGSGYQAAILSHLVKRLYTMERIKELRKSAELNIKKSNIKNVFFIQGDGTIGLSQFAPFDRIIVTAASPGVPKVLIDQLNINGIMIIPVGNLNTQVLKRIEKTEQEINEQEFDPCRFVPLIGRNGFEK